MFEDMEAAAVLEEEAEAAKVVKSKDAVDKLVALTAGRRAAEAAKVKAAKDCAAEAERVKAKVRVAAAAKERAVAADKVRLAAKDRAAKESAAAKMRVAAKARAVEEAKARVADATPAKAGEVRRWLVMAKLEFIAQSCSMGVGESSKAAKRGAVKERDGSKKMADKERAAKRTAKGSAEAEGFVLKTGRRAAEATKVDNAAAAERVAAQARAAGEERAAEAVRAAVADAARAADAAKARTAAMESNDSDAAKLAREVNHYVVLGVGVDANARQCKAAYRKRSLQFHPDRKHGHTAAFQRIAEAYEVLSDLAKRRAFNEEARRAGRAAGAARTFSSTYEDDGFYTGEVHFVFDRKTTCRLFRPYIITLSYFHFCNNGLQPFSFFHQQTPNVFILCFGVLASHFYSRYQPLNN